MDIREIILNSRKFVSEIDRMKAKVVSTNPQDTTKIVTLQCELEMNKLRANIGDSLKIYSGKTAGTGELAPKEQNSAMPMISFSMRTDSLFFNANETKLALGVAGIKAKLEKKMIRYGYLGELLVLIGCWYILLNLVYLYEYVRQL